MLLMTEMLITIQCRSRVNATPCCAETCWILSRASDCYPQGLRNVSISRKAARSEIRRRGFQLKSNEKRLR